MALQLPYQREFHVHVLPAGIKLATFDTAKGMLGRANSAYDDELVKWQRATSVKQSSSGLI